jgi:hypothetical protein
MTPAAGLTGARLRWAVERGADTALATGYAAVIVGITDGWLMVCTDTDGCVDRPGVLVAVPDLLVAEVFANGHELELTTTLRRGGRTVHLYHGPGGRHG